MTPPAAPPDRLVRTLSREGGGSVGSGETLEVCCRLCGDAYRLGPDEVGALLAGA